MQLAVKEDRPEIKFSELGNFQDRQKIAWNTLVDRQTKYMLYGGAAGGGKSHFLRWSSIKLGIWYFHRYGMRGVPIGLFSEDYPTLADRQISRFEKEVPDWLGFIRDNKKLGLHFQISQEYGGAVILFRNLDEPKKYASTEFAAEFVEELTMNPEDKFEDLRFRLRYTDPVTRVPIDDVKFCAATNPGQVGHAWVKRLWVEIDTRYPDPEQVSFKFVPSKASDNQYLAKSYMVQLGSFKDPQKVAALRDGSWDIIAGQVLDSWRREKHVVKPFFIPETWNRFMGLDWGVNKPFSVGWYATDTDGRVYKYRELYMNGDGFKERYDMELTPRRLAKTIMTINRINREAPAYMACDPSIWNQAYFGKGAKALEGGESIAEVMSKVRGMVPLNRADNDRMNGLARMRDWLATAPDGAPWFQVFETCYNTIRTLPALVYDKHKHEDVDTNAEDHAYDETRYALMSRPPITTVEQENNSPIRAEFLRRLHERSNPNNWQQYNNDNY